MYLSFASMALLFFAMMLSVSTFYYIAPQEAKKRAMVEFVEEERRRDEALAKQVQRVYEYGITHPKRRRGPRQNIGRRTTAFCFVLWCKKQSRACTHIPQDVVGE